MYTCLCIEHPDEHLGQHLDQHLDGHLLEHLFDHHNGHLHEGDGSERRHITLGLRKGVRKCVRTVIVQCPDANVTMETYGNQCPPE